jgi:hypothetical protein
VLLHIAVGISSVQMSDFWCKRKVISQLSRYLLLFTLPQQKTTTTTTTSITTATTSTTTTTTTTATTSTVKDIKTVAAVSTVTETENYSKEADLKSKSNKRISKPGKCKGLYLAIFQQPEQNISL